MKLFARIDHGIIQELYSPPPALAGFDLAELFAPGMGWRDVSAVSPAPQVGWKVEGEGFAAAPPPPSPPPAPPPSLAALSEQLATLKVQISQISAQIASFAAPGGSHPAGG